MRRRRKNRGQWLNTVGQFAGQDAIFQESPGAIHLRLEADDFEGSVNTVARGNTEVIFDFQKIDDFDAAATIPSLADLTQSAYFLERIVGNVFACAGPNANEAPIVPAAILLTTGFIINRTDQTDLPLLTADDGAPSVTVNVTDPWIWRRSWILQLPDLPAADLTADTIGKAWNPYGGLSGTSSAVAPQAHNNNWLHRALGDGPHIDQKTKRYVAAEERLFFWADAWALPLPETTSGRVYTDWFVDMQLDLRVYGNPLKGSNRRNASR